MTQHPKIRNDAPPLRVVHVLGSLGRGGAETWLAQVLQHLDRRLVEADIIVNNGEDSHYRSAVESAGCRVYVCRSLAKPLRYRREFLDLLRCNGPYDVVHSHLQLFNGLVMKLAAIAGVPVRIAHSRNANDAHALTLRRRCYRALMRYWIGRYSTYRLAVSREAALGAFGPKWGSEAQCSLMTGIDFSPFQVSVDRVGIRQSLGLPPGVRVIGHVGSFRSQKNHEFLVRLAAEFVSKHPDVRFLLIGDGPLQPEMRRQVACLGMADRILFLGDRPDVPELMLGAMDAFCFPSLYEGLPRVLLEAQAAGLPCVASAAITPEAAVGPSAVRFLGLDESLSVWFEALERILSERPRVAAGNAIAGFEDRGLTIAANARRLTALYRELRNGCRP